MESPRYIYVIVNGLCNFIVESFLVLKIQASEGIIEIKPEYFLKTILSLVGPFYNSLLLVYGIFTKILISLKTINLIYY
jgi:hypothetical protein